jgi:hypothetical protein
MLVGGLMLLPLAIAEPPTEVPTTGAIVSLLILALAGTALAGLALILLGVALGSGTLRMRRTVGATAP